MAQLRLIISKQFDHATIKSWFDAYVKEEQMEDVCYVSCQRVGLLRRWCLTYLIGSDTMPAALSGWLLTHLPYFVAQAVFTTAHVGLTSRRSGQPFKLVMRG